MRVMSLVLGVAALAMAAGLGACAEEAVEPEPVVRPIKMLTVGGASAGTREYPGRLRAGQQADMAFEVSGRIVEFVLREGQRASQGAALARLDSRDYVNLLEQAQAAERNRRTYLGRISQAHKTGAVSDQDLNDAQAQVDVAAAEVKIKQKGVDDTVLRAPFDGVMSRKLVEDFANVRAKQPVLVFEDPRTMEIKVSVPERDLAGRRDAEQTPDQITKRLQPKVIVTSMPGKVYPARVKELATTADPTTRTFEATFLFDPDRDVSVLPGMTAKVILESAGDASSGELVIPARAAVSDEKGDAAVWIVAQDGTVSMRSVTLGALRGEDAIVTAGLSAGDVIATSGMTLLRPGVKVRLWERGGTQ
jgi:multidrug efflux system membrane fusion protein